MRTIVRQSKRRNPQLGMTVIELLIAVVVLVVGLLAVIGLFATAIGSNGRSRIDTTATMVSQSVIEQITAVLARGGPAMIQDCQGTTWNIGTDPGGAALNGSGIDFTESSPPSEYSANFAVCNGTATATYDVRWHITNVSNQTSLVTVAARPRNMQNGRFTFSLPVTFRTYVGDDR
jgi:Tfp pilus assembly protein PilV